MEWKMPISGAGGQDNCPVCFSLLLKLHSELSFKIEMSYFLLPVKCEQGWKADIPVE